jgi:DNA primase
VLDGDRAGREAADRFAQALGQRWQPLELPEGCDLNDLGRQPGGRGLFFQLVASSRETASHATERIPRAQDVDD